MNFEYGQHYWGQDGGNYKTRKVKKCDGSGDDCLSFTVGSWIVWIDSSVIDDDVLLDTEVGLDPSIETVNWGWLRDQIKVIETMMMTKMEATMKKIENTEQNT